MNPLDQLVKDMNGQNDWYVTGPDEGECTAVPHEWEQRLGLPIVYGNAIDTYDNAPDDLYEKELNGPSNAPRPGAIVVWGEYAPYGISGQYGHTAVALPGCDANTIVVLEQNWGVRGVRVHSRDYGGVKGWFYPRVLEPQPAPAPAPTPEPNPPQQDPQPAPPAPDPAPAPTPPEPVVVPTEPPVAPVEPTKPTPAPIVIPVTEKPVETAKQIVTSKKFILAFLSVVTFLVSGQYDQALATVLAYLGVQGAIDHKNAG